MTTTLTATNQNAASTSATDFITYLDPELVTIFKKEYGDHFDVVIDMEMKKRTRDIMERHARRYGRSLEQDNSDASIGFYFAYTPFGYLYGQPLPAHKAMEWASAIRPSSTSTESESESESKSTSTRLNEEEIELAKSKASEINFQGESLINPNPSRSIYDSDNSRHTFAQHRKLQTSIVTSQYLELEKWW